MTKINLLRNLGGTGQVAGTSVTSASTIEFGDSQAVPLLLRFLALIVFPIGLIYYETDNLSTLRGRINRLQRELQAVDAELRAKASVAEVLKQYTTEKARLEKRMEAVRELNKTRLSEIKALDS